MDDKMMEEIAVSMDHGTKAMEEAVTMLERQGKEILRYREALERIVRTLQISKEDLICADIIRQAQKALKQK